MRVVVDTNTVVSAFLWGEPPAGVLEAARSQRISLLTGAAPLDELADALTRDKFASRIRQVGSSVPAMLSNYRALVTLGTFRHIRILSSRDALVMLLQSP